MLVRCCCCRLGTRRRGTALPRERHSPILLLSLLAAFHSGRYSPSLRLRVALARRGERRRDHGRDRLPALQDHDVLHDALVRRRRRASPGRRGRPAPSLPPVRPSTTCRNRRESRAWNPAFMLLLLPLHRTTGSRYGRGRGSHATVRRPEERAASEAVRGPGALRCHPGACWATSWVWGCRRSERGDDQLRAVVRCVAGAAELEKAGEIVERRWAARHADIYTCDTEAHGRVGIGSELGVGLGVHCPESRRPARVVLRGPRGKTGKEKNEGARGGGTRVGLALSPGLRPVHSPTACVSTSAPSPPAARHSKPGPFCHRSLLSFAASPSSSTSYLAGTADPSFGSRIGFFFCRFFLQRATSICFGFKKDQGHHRPALEILPLSPPFDASFQHGKFLIHSICKKVKCTTDPSTCEEVSLRFTNSKSAHKFVKSFTLGSNPPHRHLALTWHLLSYPSHLPLFSLSLWHFIQHVDMAAQSSTSASPTPLRRHPLPMLRPPSNTLISSSNTMAAPLLMLSSSYSS